MENRLNSTFNYGIESEQNKIVILLQMFDLEEHIMIDKGDYLGRRDDLFMNHEIADHMLDLLKSAQLSENVYEMGYLHREYQEFKKKAPVLFSLQDLFAEGWLTACRGEWDFNISYKSEYADIRHMPSEKEMQIVTFLKELAKLPYRAQLLQVSVPAEWNLPEGILQTKDGEVFLDPHGKLWIRFADALFGKWWDELAETEDDGVHNKKEQMEHWFSCWDAFGRCLRPDVYCKHADELFEACLIKLEDELQHISWERMKHIIRRKAYLKFHLQGDMPYDDFMQDYPNTRIARTLYVDRSNYFDLVQMPERLSRLYDLCLRQYVCVDRNMRGRFLKCMQNPWVYLQFYMFAGDMENTRFLTDCLSHAELYVPAACAIWQMGHALIMKVPSVGEAFLDELNKHLFQIPVHGLEWENEEEWLAAVRDILWYLNEESRWYYKNTYMRKTGMQMYLQHMHAACLAWYEKNILPKERLHNKNLEYFYAEFENSSERDVVAAFAAYMMLLKMTEEKAEYLFVVYQKFFARIRTEDTLVSQLSWSFWLDECWICMMQEVAQEKKETEAFLKLLEPEFYKEQADKLKEKSPLLQIGKAAAIQMYLMTVFLLEVRSELGEKNKAKVEAAFAECFLGFQIESCDLFQSESVRLLESEMVMRRCMEILPLLSETNRKRILSEMKKETPEKLVFLLQYVQNADIRRQWIRLLLQRQEEDFTKNIYFIPTYIKLIDCLMEICFEDETEGRKLAQKTDELLKQFQTIIKEKGERIGKQYDSWIRSAKLRMKLLMGQEQEILADGKSGSSLFYQALIYLNKEDLESLKQAERLYGICMEQEETKAGSAVYINYFVACVRICTHTETADEERKDYLQKAEDTAKEIRAKFELTSVDRKILISNELFLYLVLNDHQKFWISASYLPKELKYEFSCAGYVAEMLIAEHKTQEAEEYVKELLLRYGKTKEIKLLEAKLSDIADTEILHAPAVMFDQSSEIEKCRNVLNRLKNMPDRESALVRLQTDSLENPIEANLLELVLRAAQKMEQYSDYLMYNSHTSNENAYSKFVQVLFNQRGKEIWDFYLRDQTFEGTSSDKLKNKRQSVGIVDLMAVHNDRDVGIIEAVKLERADYNDLRMHIRKIPGYNFANVPTAFLLILADMAEPGKFWRKYEKEMLPQLIEETKNNDWHIVEQVSKENIELFRKQVRQEPLYICMTAHTCGSTNQTLHVYHLMVDIRKEAAKKEAVEAREK